MITEEISKVVEKVCYSKKNVHSPTAWTHHICIVRKLALQLADKLKADKEIVELAALLHDIGSVSKGEWLDDHHIHGARLAKKLLEKYDYPSDRTERILHCILAHRASLNIKRKTIESEIIASADAMSHIEKTYQLLHLAYFTRNMGVEEGREFVLKKIKNSWKKLMPEAKEIMKKKCEAALVILGDMD